MCRCPNVAACNYSNRQERLREFAESLACHRHTPTPNTSAAASQSPWTVVPNCIHAAIIDSLRVTPNGADLSLEDSWMAEYPQCSSGYMGRLCANCALGFGQGQQPFSCMPCPHPKASLLVLVTGLLGTAAMLAYTIRAALVPLSNALEGQPPDHAMAAMSNKFNMLKMSGLRTFDKRQWRLASPLQSKAGPVHEAAYSMTQSNVVVGEVLADQQVQPVHIACSLVDANPVWHEMRLQAEAMHPCQSQCKASWMTGHTHVSSRAKRPAKVARLGIQASAAVPACDLRRVQENTELGNISSKLAASMAGRTEGSGEWVIEKKGCSVGMCGLHTSVSTGELAECMLEKAMPDAIGPLARSSPVQRRMSKGVQRCVAHLNRQGATSGVGNKTARGHEWEVSRSSGTWAKRFQGKVEALEAGDLCPCEQCLSHAQCAQTMALPKIQEEHLGEILGRREHISLPVLAASGVPACLQSHLGKGSNGTNHCRHGSRSKQSWSSAQSCEGEQAVQLASAHNACCTVGVQADVRDSRGAVELSKCAAGPGVPIGAIDKWVAARHVRLHLGWAKSPQDGVGARGKSAAAGPVVEGFDSPRELGSVASLHAPAANELRFSVKAEPDGKAAHRDMISEMSEPACSANELQSGRCLHTPIASIAGENLMCVWKPKAAIQSQAPPHVACSSGQAFVGFAAQSTLGGAQRMQQPWRKSRRWKRLQGSPLGLHGSHGIQSTSRGHETTTPVATTELQQRATWLFMTPEPTIPILQATVGTFAQRQGARAESAAPPHFLPRLGRPTTAATSSDCSHGQQEECSRSKHCCMQMAARNRFLSWLGRWHTSVDQVDQVAVADTRSNHQCSAREHRGSPFWRPAAHLRTAKGYVQAAGGDKPAGCSRSLTSRGRENAQSAQPAPRVQNQMIKIVISYMQVISVVRNVDLYLPESLRHMFQAQGSTEGWARVLAWDCLLLTSYEQHAKAAARVLVVMALPCGFELLFVLFWIAKCFLTQPGRVWSYLGKRLTVTTLCTAFFFYPTVSAAALKVFSCVRISDSQSNTNLLPFRITRRGSGQFWSMDTDLECWTGLHRCSHLYRLPLPCYS
jgi:hypothetical protein